MNLAILHRELHEYVALLLLSDGIVFDPLGCY